VLALQVAKVLNAPVETIFSLEEEEN
jgi:DNA-binding XRE family transcriptional regulator